MIGSNGIQWYKDRACRIRSGRQALVSLVGNDELSVMEAKLRYDDQVKIQCTTCGLGTNVENPISLMPLRDDHRKNPSYRLMMLTEKSCPNCEQKTLIEKTW